jgi:cbb3-type cytochrome oxidase subunit 3
MTFLSTILADVGNLAVDPSFFGQQTDGVAVISNFIQQMVTLLFVVGFLAFFFMFLLGGIRWITSGGDKGQVESARSQIVQAITGLVVLVSVYAVAKLLQSIFGINLINVDLTPILAK